MPARDLDAVPAPATTRLLELLEQLRADTDLLLDASRAAQRAGSEVEQPGATSAGVLPTEEVGRHVRAVLAAVTAGVRGDQDAAAVLEAADELAVDRAAQGVTLEVLLAGVHAARQTFLDLLAARLRGRAEADQVIDMLVVLDRETGRLQNRMILAFHDAQASLARTTGAARLELLRSMVGSGDPAAAGQLGLDPSARYCCVVADVSTPQQARAAEGRLVTADGASGLVLGYLTRICGRLPSADRVAGLLAVHSPPVPVEELPAAHALCRAALEPARRAGVTGLTPVTGYALALATGGEPLLGRLLAAERLAGLDLDDEFHRQLVETGLAFLDSGGRLGPTAAALHVHPNTVSHRLRRLGGLTGFATDPPSAALTDAVGWWWAFSAWAPQPAPGPARPAPRGPS